MVKDGKSFIKDFRKIIFIESVLFVLTLLLAIATAQKSYSFITAKNIKIPEVDFWQFVSPFLITTAFVFFLVRFLKFYKKKAVIFRILFLLAVFSGGLITLGVWFEGFLPIIVIISLIILWQKKPSIFVQDLCLVLAISGSASYLGLFLRPETIIRFLILFSVYDFIAVYKTKHMVELAKEMIASKAILGMVIPSDFSGFFEPLSKVKPGNKFLVLGAGDIISPVLLCCSMVPFGVLKSLIVGFFSLIGVFCSVYIFYNQKERKPIPALPPIALFSIIGFLVAKSL